MKPISKIWVIVLGAGLCGMLAILFVSAQRRKDINRESLVSIVREESGSVRVLDTVRKHSERTNAVQSMNVVSAIAATNHVLHDVSHKTTVNPFSPAEIGYTPTIKIGQSEVILSIMNAVSNAVSSADRILKTKNYKNIEQFNQIMWLESIDEAQSTVWRVVPDWKITPDGTNAVVGAIEAIVYQDVALTQKDPSKSFKMGLNPQNGTLRNFFWADKHEMLVVQANSDFVDYAKDLGGKKRLVIGWDAKGMLVSSNVYDWAVRGRIISGSTKRDGDK